ncbi:phosphonate C-P lyase system protein PhnL [Kyrpidia spormannii]|uniref:Phosphonate C-P lyase system protein PhnL n=1 Tax=Kyrpidia spormannii TaxID=2055160 RepID=A0A6F9EGR3_9BACL|nr:ATP-binding cassette domain-containing protein [Kyrpidia spormannii]CAB3396126.1 Phosphonate C-P lyase system protein PhnL [Kyrpidia spormannii]
MALILDVKGLHKIFRIHHTGKTIVGVGGVHFSLEEGEFLGITGKSGSGKSSLLKCIFRTYLPTRGTMVYCSERYGAIDLAQATEQQVIALRRREIGYALQFLNVLPRLTAMEVVVGKALEAGVSRDAAEREAREILRRFQLPEKLWDTYPHTFSGGEKLRLNLAKEMVKRPRLLLLDEPTASLDESSKRIVRDLLGEFKRAGTSMIGIFHDLDFMEQVVDREIRMNDGVIAGDIPA